MDQSESLWWYFYFDDKRVKDVIKSF